MPSDFSRFRPLAELTRSFCASAQADQPAHLADRLLLLAPVRATRDFSRITTFFATTTTHPHNVDWALSLSALALTARCMRVAGGVAAQVGDHLHDAAQPAHCAHPHRRVDTPQRPRWESCRVTLEVERTTSVEEGERLEMVTTRRRLLWWRRRAGR